MSPLKTILLVTLAVSISLLLFGTARAVDHPWDDSTVDSTWSGSPDDGSVDGDDQPEVDENSLLKKFTSWVNGFFRNFLSIQPKSGSGEVDTPRRDHEPKSYKAIRHVHQFRRK